MGRFRRIWRKISGAELREADLRSHNENIRRQGAKRRLDKRAQESRELIKRSDAVGAESRRLSREADKVLKK